MSTEPSTGITPKDLHAYFDDELLPDQAATVTEAIEADPSLQLEHAQLRGMHSAVGASFDAVARAVPQARFEQIWDEIDRAIERDERLQAEADRNASIWTRLWAALRPVRVPLAAAAAAAAVTVILVRPGADEPNKPESVASVDEQVPPAETEAKDAEPEPLPETKIAAAPSNPEPPKAEPKPEPLLAPMPVPQTHDAEIHGIEFGVRSGRISNTGTVTVLYVEEDEASTNSERSL